MLDGKAHHPIALGGAGIGDGRSVIAFFGRQLLKELRLVGGCEVLCGQVKVFGRERLFEGGPAYRFAYVDQDGFDRHPPASLAELLTMFREYQAGSA